jgi:hypothetical protein
MRDDKTANTIADQTHIPLPSLAPSIPCPASHRCATAVPVGASRRSDPAISRFCPVVGCRTMLQLLARRAAESNAFSVPDRNALWSRAEDGLLVEKIAEKKSDPDGYYESSLHELFMNIFKLFELFMNC